MGKASIVLHGIPISTGLAGGEAVVLDSRLPLQAALASDVTLSPKDEIERLSAARSLAVAQLESVQQQLTLRGRSIDASIFATHSSLLSDPSLTKQIETRISNERLSAETAVALVVLDVEKQFLSSSSSLLQDKAADILDLGQRLIRCLRRLPELESVEQRVLVSPSLTPSELLRAAHLGAIAAVTESCGRKSHTAILARGFGMPLVTGISGLPGSITNGTHVFVDGNRGIVVVNPEADEQRMAESMVPLLSSTESETPVDAEAVTTDGVRVAILLNISDLREAEEVHRLGADGVGLYRTEFFYLGRAGWPSEQESFDHYSTVASVIGGRDLNIRLADFGAEKCPAYADIPLSRNPSLGIRGVRLLLSRDDILKPQVKALERVGRERPLTVLLPMVDTLDTLRAITDRMCRHCACRNREELPFQLGMMVEVPAAAIQIEDMIDHVDAVSVGLNDLTQYLLAADRDDEFVEAYHDALQPAVLRTVKQVIETAVERDKPVTLCGELAGDPALASILLGLGARRFSVSRSDYLRAVKHFQQLDASRQSQIARRATSCDSRNAVSQLLASENHGDTEQAR